MVIKTRRSKHQTLQWRYHMCQQVRRRQTKAVLVLSDKGNSEGNAFASSEAKWLHHNRKPIPPKNNI